MQALVCTLCLTLIASTASAVSFNQVDVFEDGTNMGWHGSKVSGMVTNLPDGGPLGAGDGYLETSVSGFHLGAKNATRWTGDYLAAGIEAIEMDLNRSASSSHALTIRILLFGPGGTFASAPLTPPVTTNSWSHHVFDLTTNDLVHIPGNFKIPDGTMVLEDTLQSVTNLLIRHDYPVPTPPGQHPPHITATLGIDNIHAVSRQPLFTGLQVTGGVASVELGDLVAGTSNVLDEATDLIDPDWTNRFDFTASGTTTNVSVPAGAGAGHFRVRVP